MIEKGLASDADAIFLDLEDSVASSEKDSARKNVISALNDRDWGKKQRIVRINDAMSPQCYRDLVDILEGSGSKLDRIILPKADSAEMVTTVGMLLHQIEAAVGRAATVVIDAQIESARGLVNCESIAVASDRVASLVFGPGDFAGSTGMPVENLGVHDEWDMAYGSHRWHYPMSRIVVAAKAAEIQAFDGPVADFRDSTGLRRSAMTARALGFDGKWCIHPNQISVINDVFTPAESEIMRAKQLVAAMHAGEEQGKGAVAVEGQMLDAASLRVARMTIERARSVGLID
ncbi:CoA ester lyase [soil metagenome]